MTYSYIVFECIRWNRIWDEAIIKLEVKITLDTIIDIMIETKDRWEAGHTMIRIILNKKRAK